MIIDHNANKDALVTTTNTFFLSSVFFPGMTSLTRLGVCCRYHHDHIGHILLNEDHHDLCGDAGNEDHLICAIMISWWSLHWRDDHWDLLDRCWICWNKWFVLRTTLWRWFARCTSSPQSPPTGTQAKKVEEEKTKETEKTFASLL